MIPNTHNSLFNYTWQLLNEDKTLQAFEKILANRDLDEKIRDPWDFSDMKKAVDRIKKAIGNKERIMIFGDYDADGITSAAILLRVLKEMGAEVSCRIPHREDDGYGLNMKFVDEFIKADVKLLITVDCGIACPHEIKKAEDNGIDTIVTDHHEVPLVPAEPYAIIHSRDLAGAGVAYKLACALLGDEAEKYIDLAAIGTIADVVPLTGENRVIATKGLKKMAETSWPGLEALIKVSQIDKKDFLELDSHTVGYRIGPRLNASGRLGDPYLSLKILISDDEKVMSMVEQLNQINIDRQDLVRGILNDLKYDKNDSIIVIKGDWPKGVLGLISGRITEETGKPSVVLMEDGDMLTGSARSPEFFHITEAFQKLDEYLEEYGGHRKAAGLTFKKENFEIFSSKLKKMLSLDEIPPKTLKIDAQVEPSELGKDFYEKLESLKPYGEANAQPILKFENVLITKARIVGQKQNHLSIEGKFGQKDIKGILFNVPAEVDIAGKTVSIAAKIKKDTFAPDGYGLQVEDVMVC